jgi:hypothetical protein
VELQARQEAQEQVVHQEHLVLQGQVVLMVFQVLQEHQVQALLP